MKRRKAIKGLAAALGGLAAIPGCKKELVPVASCYVTVVDYYEDYVCSHCGNTIKEKYTKQIISYIGQIEYGVNQMKGLGYDVILDKTEFCPHCSKKGIENPVLIFKIRFSEEADYHIARSNIINEYYCLYEFLKNPDEYLETQDVKTLPEKIAIIRKMTGLGEDLKIKKQ